MDATLCVADQHALERHRERGRRADLDPGLDPHPITGQRVELSSPLPMDFTSIVERMS
jgi:hypothetical protein